MLDQYDVRHLSNITLTWFSRTLGEKAGAAPSNHPALVFKIFLHLFTSSNVERMLPYPIFVNFGKKYTKKMRKFVTKKDQNVPKIHMLYAKKYTGFKKCTTAGLDGCDQCQLWML